MMLHLSSDSHTTNISLPPTSSEHLSLFRAKLTTAEAATHCVWLTGPPADRHQTSWCVCMCACVFACVLVCLHVCVCVFAVCVCVCTYH